MSNSAFFGGLGMTLGGRWCRRVTQQGGARQGWGQRGRMGNWAGEEGGGDGRSPIMIRSLLTIARVGGLGVGGDGDGRNLTITIIFFFCGNININTNPLIPFVFPSSDCFDATLVSALCSCFFSLVSICCEAFRTVTNSPAAHTL